MLDFLIRRDRAPPNAIALPPLGEPTSLLVHLAGELANRVAGLWPAPHADFITLPAHRRHLILIALARAGDKPLPCHAHILVEASVKEAITAGIPGAPEGLKGALSRLGETGWTVEDYARLFHVLRLGAKQVRHGQTVTPQLVRALAALPEPLLKARVGGFGLDEPGARIVAEAFRLITAAKGQEAAAAAVLRWSGTATPKALFEAVEDDLLPAFPPPPFRGSAQLRPLTTRAEVREAAVRFQNCLRTRIPEIARGRAAVFEWTGTPAAVVEIVEDDIYGWRLSQARTRRNGNVPEAGQASIRADLERMGVHIGLSQHQLQGALASAQDGHAWFPDHADDVRWMFEDD